MAIFFWATDGTDEVYKSVFFQKEKGRSGHDQDTDWTKYRTLIPRIHHAACAVACCTLSLRRHIAT